MAGRIANVWAVECPKCDVQLDEPCLDLSARKLGRRLFGRRTHRERARKLRELGRDGRETKLDEAMRRFRAKYRTGAITAPEWTRNVDPWASQLVGQPYDWNDLTPITQTRMLVNYTPTVTASANSTITWDHPATFATGGTTYVTRDEMWNGWMVGNNTTGTSTLITDEDMVRFEGTGITWDQQFQITTNGYANVIQEAVYNRWQVIHEREVPSPEELQRIADEVQRRREAESRRRLELEQRRQQIEEERMLAQIKGLELLLMILTDEQRAQYDLNARIPVRGSQGGLYEIDTLYGGVHGNVVQVDEHGCILGRVCVAPRMNVDGHALPMADGWVGQLLAIKTDETNFRQRGNWSSVRPCMHPDVPILGQAA